MARPDQVVRFQSSGMTGLGATAGVAGEAARDVGAGHLAQQTSLGGLLHEVAEVHHVGGHLGLGLAQATRPYRNIAGDHSARIYTTRWGTTIDCGENPEPGEGADPKEKP